ncbi:MAG: hypothetical protein KAQ64_02470 [Candidatus Pacebacteria bacterium]|nr:hypothetical protein [Candidatus Paceibacterota bacterium]
MSGKSIVSIILIYVVLNLVLWGAQELHYKEDTQEINKIEKWLNIEEKEINSLEKKINNQSFEIEQMESKLNNLERQGSITSYNYNVEKYNSLLEEYNDNFDIYDEKFAKYNNEINHFNELIKKSGLRWYLITIPLSTKSTRSKL